MTETNAIVNDDQASIGLDLNRTRSLPSISCVMPAYNEARNLGAVVPVVLEALVKLSQRIEIIVINDGSRDSTAKILIDLCNKYPQIVALNLSRNFGKEAALTAGLDAAQGEVVIIMDADGQHPVNLIAAMLQKWNQGSDVVYAVRKTRHDQSPIHRAFTRVFYRLINWKSRVQIPPNAGDFRLMDKRVVQALRNLPERNRFMKDLVEGVANKLREAVEKKYRVEGELRHEVKQNIKRLKEIGCYRGSRHQKNLPSRGQRTKTNTRTVRGNVRKTMGSGRKKASEKT